MNKDSHDMDEFFNSAYQQFEDEPSAGMWEKINAGLDKKDADSRRRKFIWWRRTAVLLLLLLTGFALFDPVIFKNNPGHSNDNTIIKKSRVPAPPAKYVEMNSPEMNSAHKEIMTQDEKNEPGNSVENNLLVKQDDITSLSTSPGSGRKDERNKKPANDKHLLVINHSAITITQSKPEESTNDLLKKNERLQEKQISLIPFIEKINTGNPLTPMFNSKWLIQLPVPCDAVLKNNNAKIKKHGKNNSFIPYWTLTAFASYERAGYQLDSELPGNITSIKHSEIHEPSFSGGILATRQLSKNWGLQTGLVYSNMAIGISPQKLYALQDPGGDIAFKYITSSGYAYIKPGLGVPPAMGDSLKTTEGKHTMQFIRIPLVVKYSVGNNKVTITPGAGIEANFLISAKVETEIEHPVNPEIVFIDKLDAAKPFHLSFFTDVELRYVLNKKLSVNIRPAFRYAISPITKNNVVETFPYSFGLSAGATIKF